MFKKLTIISLATLSFAPLAARADLATDPKPVQIAAAVVNKSVDAAKPDSIEISLEGRWTPRHHESQAFWDKFNSLVYPGGAGAGGDGGGN